MQTRFYIEKRKDESGNLILKDRPVFMSVSLAGDRLMFGTGIKADYQAWDSDLQRIKSSFPDSVTANIWLDTLSDTASKAWLNMQSRELAPGGEQFRKIFQELKPKYSRGFFEVFFLFMEWGMAYWSTASYRKVRTIYRHLREFEDATGYAISFGSMGGEFIERFQSFYREKGNNPTTTRKAINIVVWFLNWATEKGFNVNVEYKKFYKSMEKAQGSPLRPVFLKWDELTRIRDLECSSKRKERVKDLFCFMCFTGLRFSELQNLKKEDLLNDEIIIRKKNGKLRKVHMNAPARELHDRYKNKYYLNNTAFPSMSVITMNKYLKILALEAGLIRSVSDGKNPEQPLPLHKLISAGMGVNTFLANAIRLKIPAEVISSFTGVQKDSRFRHIRKEIEKAELEKFDNML